MDDKKFRRSNDIEDRRKERLPLGPFGTPGLPPNVYEGGGTMEKLDPKQMAPVQRTSAGKALGLDELERAALDQEQNNQVRDALDNPSVAIPGQDDPNGPPVRINNRGTAAPVPLMSATSPAQAAIVQAAKEAGVDPAYALAIAERESDFNPQAKASKTIRGLYQMSGELRKKYGVGDSQEPIDQARGWMKSLPDIKRDMKSVLGRDPTDQEAYLGHHYGAKRAARTLTMDPSTPVDSIFTPQEMAANPHFARAATIGNLNGSVMGDVDKRMARFGGTNAPSRPAEPATAPASAPDLSSFGEAIGVDGGGGAGAVTAQPKLADLSSFGEPVQ